MTLPRIGLTAGDPAGIGLEVALGALTALGDVGRRARWTLFVTRPDWLAGIERFGSEVEWTEGSDDTARGVLGVEFVSRAGSPIEWGLGSPESGRRGVAALARAREAARSGLIDAIVTAPLNKAMAGEGFRGQTEFLSEGSGRPTAMSFFTPTFKVVLATTHVALRDAIDLLSVDRYRSLIRLVASELARFGWHDAHMVLASVNPHAGEGGRFGTEDDAILSPAAEWARGEGLRVSGPLPADSLYARAHAGEFDVVIAPYHDQALAPVKLIAPRTAANVTLGLKYVRTSPDHGTAYDIAGRGVASADGMQTAMEWAIDLIGRQALRQKRQRP